MKIRKFLPAFPVLPRAKTAAAIGAIALAGALQAQPILVPGGSFESPTPPPGFPVNIKIDSWQESPQPFWYDPVAFGNTTWDQLSGVFPNPPPESVANHIDNIHGNQAAYLFAVSSVALFQDHNTLDWDDAAPPHDFNATFELGKSYNLTVGVIGSSALFDGANLRISLYYRDGGNNMVTVGATDIFYSAASFPSITHFNDYQVTVPAVQAEDAWAGQNIGIQIEAISMGGSYWDIDNVRLTAAVPEPGSVSLLGLGFAGLLWVRTRALKKSKA